MKFKTFGNPFSLTRRNLVINFIATTVYTLVEKKWAKKLFFIIGKLYSPNLRIGEFLVATTDCFKLHPRLKAQMLGRVIGIVDSYQSLVMIKVYPSCFHSKKYEVPVQLFPLNFIPDDDFYSEHPLISQDRDFYQNEIFTS